MCSRGSFSYVESCGADAVFDYVGDVAMGPDTEQLGGMLLADISPSSIRLVEIYSPLLLAMI